MIKLFQRMIKYKNNVEETARQVGKKPKDNQYYREGFSIDDIIAQSGSKSRSSIFRILNDAGIDLNRGRTQGPFVQERKKKTLKNSQLISEV